MLPGPSPRVRTSSCQDVSQSRYAACTRSLAAASVSGERPLGRLRAQQAPGQRDQRGSVGGDGVHLAIVQHLQQVFGAAQQRVIVGKLPRPVVGQQTGLRQPLDAAGGMAGQHARMLAGAGELQPLHQELDVPDPPAAVLDVYPAPQAARPRRRHRRGGGVRVAHPRDRGRHLGVAEAAPDDRLQALQQPFPERDVAGDGATAQQRLHLPQSGAPLVVVHERRRAGDQFPRPAVRPQPQVHPVGVLLAGVRAQVLPQPGGERGGALPQAGLARVVHRRQVDVRAVVELAPSQLAERQDRHAVAQLAIQVGADALQRDGHHRVGDRRQLRGRHRDRGAQVEVAGSDAQQLPAAEQPDGAQPALVVGGL